MSLAGIRPYIPLLLRMRIFFLLCLLLTTSFVASATQVYWTGEGDGISYSDTSNWSAKRIPIATDSILINEVDTIVCTSAIQAKYLSLTKATFQFHGGTLSVESGTMFGCRIEGSAFSIYSTDFVFGNFGGKTTIEPAVVVYTETVSLRETDFFGSFTLEKLGNELDIWYGLNHFYEDVSISLQNEGGIILAGAFPDVFERDLAFSLNPESSIHLANKGYSTQVYGNISVSLNGANFYVGQGGGAMQVGGDMDIDAFGGRIRLKRTTISGHFVAGGDESGKMEIHEDNKFLGSFQASSGSIITYLSDFFGPTTFSKLGPNNDLWLGDNTFSGQTTFSNYGSGFLVVDNVTPNVFLNTINFQLYGDGSFYIGNSNDTSAFSFPISISSFGGEGGFYIGQNGGEVHLQGTATLNISGPLSLLNVTNLLSSVTSPFQWDMQETSKIELKGNNHFQSALTCSAGSVRIDSSFFEGRVSILKSGAASDTWQGGSLFAGGLDLEMLDGRIFMGNKYPTRVLNSMVIENISNAQLFPAYRSQGNEIHNFHVEMAADSEIRFGQLGGSCSLRGDNFVESNEFSIVNTDFNFKNVEFSSPSACSMNVDSNSVVYFEKGCTIAAPLRLKVGGFRSDSTQFLHALTVHKSGPSYDFSQGGNVFQDSTVLIGDRGTMVFGGSNADEFRSKTNLSVQSGSKIILSFGSAEPTAFYDDVDLSLSGGEIRFGANRGASEIKSGASFNYGDNPSNVGYLYLTNVAFSENSIPALTLGDSTFCTLDSCSFESDLTVDCHQLNLQKNRFEKDVVIHKRGGQGSYSYGQNVFEGQASFHNWGPGTFALATLKGDEYGSDVSVHNHGTGNISIAHGKDPSLFNGTLEINGSGGNIQIGVMGADHAFTTLSSGDITATNILFNKVEFNGTEGWFVADTGSIINVINESKFWGATQFESGGINLSNSFFYGNLGLRKTGTLASKSPGGNQFYAPVKFELEKGVFYFSGQENADFFHDTLGLSLKAGKLLFGGAGAETRFGPNTGLTSFDRGVACEQMIMDKVVFEAGSFFDLELNPETKVSFQGGSVVDIPLDLRGSLMALGSTFNAPVKFTQIGSAYWVSSGGNVFNDSLVLDHRGSNQWGFLDNQVNGPLELKLDHSGLFYFSGSVFRGDVVFDIDNPDFNPLILNKAQFAGGGVQKVHFTQPYDLKLDTLIAANDGDLYWSGSGLTIASLLQLSKGKLVLDSNEYLSLEKGGLITGFSENAYLVGGVKKFGGVYEIMPIGNMERFAPVGYFNFGNQNTEVVVSFKDSAILELQEVDPDIEHLNPCGFWDFELNSAASVLPILYWDENMDVSCNPYHLNLLKGFTWSQDSGLKTFDLESSSSEIIGYDGLELVDGILHQSFQLSTGVPIQHIPLPFEIDTYTVEHENDTLAKIHLAVQGESNTALYELQRSHNGRGFERAGTLPGRNNAGTSLYAFTDGLHQPGFYEYRIRQQSFTGKSSYTAIKSIQVGEVNGIYFYPNPASDRYKIAFSVSAAKVVEISYFDTFGRLVYQETRPKEEGSGDLEVPLPQFMEDGVYTVQVKSGASTYVHRLMVVEK